MKRLPPAYVYRQTWTDKALAIFAGVVIWLGVGGVVYCLLLGLYLAMRR